MAALLLGARWALALVLLSAGCAKLLTQDLKRRREAVANYGVVPRQLRGTVTYALPWVEIALGALLLFGVVISITSLVVAALLTLFAVVVGWHLRHGHRFDCGCGTATDAVITWRLVARDVALAGFALAIAVGPSGYLAVWPDCFSAGHYHLTTQNLLPIPMIVIVSAAIGRLASGRIEAYLRDMTPQRLTAMMPRARDGKGWAL